MMRRNVFFFDEQKTLLCERAGERGKKSKRSALTQQLVAASHFSLSKIKNTDAHLRAQHAKIWGPTLTLTN